MSEQKIRIAGELNILILCLMTAFPVAWLLQTAKSTDISMQYFILYYGALLFVDLLLIALDRDKMLYYGAAVLPVAVFVVFKDRELTLNAVSAFIVFTLLMLLYRSRRSRIVLAVISVALIVICMEKTGMPRIVAISLVGLITLAVSGYVTKHNKYALTMVMLIECIVFLINVDTTPLLWKPLVKGADKVWRVVDGAFKNAEYKFGAFDNVSYTGYGEPGGMFKGVNYRYREELNVEVVGKITMIYLKGASYATISKDGVSGKIEEDITDNGWFALYLNSLYNAGISKAEARSFSKLLKVNVKYEYMETDDVMRSANLLSIVEDNGNGKKEKDHEYSFNYVALDYANPYLDAVVRGIPVQSGLRNKTGYGTGMAYDYYYKLNKSLAGNNDGKFQVAPYFIIKDYAYKIYNINLDNIMDKATYEQAFINYEKDMTDKRYLDDSFVTDRIRQLSLDVTKAAVTDYDKARSIEAFLRQYSYDTSVDLRGKDNFIEAFLFETQSGYCAHYATAMVEMLRSVGIPARYTQGYRHITDKGELIYSNESHAWPEAFIKGMGWVPFEPTVIFVSAPESGWGLRPEEEKVDDDMEEISGYDPATAIPPSDVETQKKKAGANGDTNGGTDSSSIKDTIIDLLKHSGIYLLGIILVAGVLVMIYRVYEVIRYRRMNAQDKVFADIGMISKKCDKHLSDDVKILSVFDYIPYIKQKKTEYDLNDVFEEYYRIRYRGDEPSAEYVIKLHELAKSI